jgi:TolB protein
MHVRRPSSLLLLALATMFAAGSPSGAQSPSPLPDAATSDGLIVFGTEPADCQTFHTIRPDGSEPTQLAGDCGPQNHVRWLPGSTGIIYDRGPDPARNVFVSDPDGSDARAITTLTDGTIWSPSVSADGTTMVYERDTLNSAIGIFLADADGTNERQLTVAPDPIQGYDGRPDLSPDGSRVVFTRVTGPNSADLWVIGVDGTGLRQLTHDLPFPDYPRWSPDGARVLFSTDQGSSPQDMALWVIDADGSHPTRLTPADGSWSFNGDWSPDGSRIVHEYYERGWDHNDLRVIDADGSHPVTIVTNPPHTTSETPDWGVAPGP